MASVNLIAMEEELTFYRVETSVGHLTIPVHNRPDATWSEREFEGLRTLIVLLSEAAEAATGEVSALRKKPRSRTAKSSTPKSLYKPLRRITGKVFSL